MLDKIIIHSSRKEAHLIFTDRSPVGIYSDVDVVPLLMWFLDMPCARLVINYCNDTVTGIELVRDTSDEITVKINLKDVA